MQHRINLPENDNPSRVLAPDNRNEVGRESRPSAKRTVRREKSAIFLVAGTKREKSHKKSIRFFMDYHYREMFLFDLNLV